MNSRQDHAETEIRPLVEMHAIQACSWSVTSIGRPIPSRPNRFNTEAHPLIVRWVEQEDTVIWIAQGACWLR